MCAINYQRTNCPFFIFTTGYNRTTSRSIEHHLAQLNDFVLYTIGDILNLTVPTKLGKSRNIFYTNGLDIALELCFRVHLCVIALDDDFA